MNRIPAKRGIYRILSHPWSKSSQSLPCYGPRCLYSTSGGTDAAASDQTIPTLPKEARVVICGGGIAGLSAAYHISNLGWKDVLLVDQGSLTCGTTWHSVGLVGAMRRHKFLTEMCRRSAYLYQTLPMETGISTGYKQSGSVAVAKSKDRMTEFRLRIARSEALGYEMELVTPTDIEQLIPWIRVDDLEGGLLIPGDGSTNPTDTCMALAKGARDNGVTIVEKTEILEIHTKNGRVSSVRTDRGDVQCDYFVNTAGMWARDVGLRTKPPVRVPVQPNEHQYLVTKPLEGLQTNTPFLRDYDGQIYIREWGGGLLCGAFCTVGKPVFPEGRIPKGEFLSLADDWDLFQPHLDAFLHRVPAAENLEVRQLFNGPEVFTPDGHILFGDVPELPNYFVMCGFNANGVALAGGGGQFLAEWIVHGRPSRDPWIASIKRLVPHHNSRQFLLDRVKEVEGRSTLSHQVSFIPYQTGRQLKCSALYARWAQAGAVFGERMGLERPKFYMDVDDTDEYIQDVQRGTFSKPGWFDLAKSEYWACREAVCLMEMSAFAKFELESTGDEALNFLQKLCPNEMDIPIGGVAHTAMLNENGCYENDCSVGRLDQNRFFIISPTVARTAAYVWIKRHLPTDGSVNFRDISDEHTALNVLGPRGREVLQKLTPSSLKNFKPFMCKEIDVGYAENVRCLSITHAGEDGFVLYIPNEHAVQIYDALLDVGYNYGIRHAGYFALRWLRIEKFYAYWGEDFGYKNTPLEIGREMRVKYDKDIDFIGKEALIQQKAQGIKRRLAMFFLEDFDYHTELWPWGGEPIYHNDLYSGMTTCSSYGPSIGKMICLGWITNPHPETGELQVLTNEFINAGLYEINIAGKMVRAKCTLYPSKLSTKQPMGG